MRVTIAPAGNAVDRIVMSEPGSRFCSELTPKGRSTMEFERQDVQADARVHTCEQVHRGRRRTDHTNVPADIRRRDVLRGSRGRRRPAESGNLTEAAGSLGKLEGRVKEILLRRIPGRARA